MFLLSLALPAWLSPAGLAAAIWLGVLVLLVVLEVSSAPLVAIWFMPGAVLSAILAACDASVGVQIAVFAVLSALLLIFPRTKFGREFMKRFKKENTKTNLDLVVGQVGIIQEDVNNLEGKGSVKVGGMIWSARTESVDETLSAGDEITVLRIEGVKLICRKK